MCMHHSKCYKAARSANAHHGLSILMPAIKTKWHGSADLHLIDSGMAEATSPTRHSGTKLDLTPLNSRCKQRRLCRMIPTSIFRQLQFSINRKRLSGWDKKYNKLLAVHLERTRKLCHCDSKSSCCKLLYTRRTLALC